MRRYNFDEYIKNKAEFSRVRLNSSCMKNVLSSNRPRSVTEEKILIKLDKERWDRWQKEGKIKVIAPRKFVYVLV